MGIKALMGGEVFLNNVIDGGNNDARLFVCDDFGKRYIEELIEADVVIMLHGYFKTHVIGDVLAVEFEFLDRMCALAVYDPDPF